MIMRHRRGDIASLRYTAWGGAIYLRRDMALRAEPPVGAIHESPAKTTHIKKLVILSVSEGSLNIPPCGDIPFLLYYTCIFVRKGP